MMGEGTYAMLCDVNQHAQSPELQKLYQDLSREP